jgi:hypothetical protein
VQNIATLTLDLQGWVERQGDELAGERRAITSSVDRERAEVDRIDRLAGKVRADYARQLDAGHDGAAKVAADTLADLDGQREQAQHRLDELTATLDAAPVEPDHDALLDLYSALRDALAGHVRGSTVGDVNARLREAIALVEVDPLEDDSVRLTGYMTDAFVSTAGVDPDSVALAEFTARRKDETPANEPDSGRCGVREAPGW